MEKRPAESAYSLRAGLVYDNFVFLFSSDSAGPRRMNAQREMFIAIEENDLGNLQ